jgi:hypothetical protein
MIVFKTVQNIKYTFHSFPPRMARINYANTYNCFVMDPSLSEMIRLGVMYCKSKIEIIILICIIVEIGLLLTEFVVAAFTAISIARVRFLRE